MIFTAYSLYTATQDQKRDTKRRQIDRDNDYWMRIFSTFVMNPNLREMHKEIYGDSIPVNEHSMFSMMMQVVENIAEGHQYNISRMDDSWRAAIYRWVQHPLFPTYWRENRNEFSYEAQAIIDSIIRVRI